MKKGKLLKTKERREKNRKTNCWVLRAGWRRRRSAREGQLSIEGEALGRLWGRDRDLHEDWAYGSHHRMKSRLLGVESGQSTSSRDQREETQKGKCHKERDNPTKPTWDEVKPELLGVRKKGLLHEHFYFYSMRERERQRTDKRKVWCFGSLHWFFLISFFYFLSF